MSRLGKGLAILYAEAKNMKSLTLHTHGCHKARLRDCSFSLLLPPPIDLALTKRLLIIGLPQRRNFGRCRYLDNAIAMSFVQSNLVTPIAQLSWQGPHFECLRKEI